MFTKHLTKHLTTGLLSNPVEDSAYTLLPPYQLCLVKYYTELVITVLLSVLTAACADDTIMCSGPEAASLLIFRLGGQYCWNPLMTVMGLFQWRLKPVCMCIIQCFLLFQTYCLTSACLHLIRHFHLFRFSISR